MNADELRSTVADSLALKQDFFEKTGAKLLEAGLLMVDALRAGRKILAFGNGGSAADAQHFAAELVNRFAFDRPALAAIALTTDSSILTSVANDSDFRMVFRRQVEALGSEGDVALAISTSGNSPNVLEAVSACRGKESQNDWFGRPRWRRPVRPGRALPHGASPRDVAHSRSSFHDRALALSDHRGRALPERARDGQIELCPSILSILSIYPVSGPILEISQEQSGCG